MLTSSEPVGTGWDQMPARRRLKRSARGTPPRRIPTSATSLLVSFLSAISCAMRVRARLRAEALRMTVDSDMHSLATSRDDFKGARQAGYELAVACRLLRHFERCLMIQSVNARSNPMSQRAFSDSIHL